MTVAFSNSARSQQFVRMQLSSTCKTLDWLETAVAEVCFIDHRQRQRSIMVTTLYICYRPVWMYRPVKQRPVEHFVSRSKWLSGSVLQQFRHGDLFRADLCAGYWTARWRNHDAMARLTARQRNHSSVTANNAQEYFKRAYFLPFIDSVLYRSTRRAFHSSKSCCLPAKCVLPAFLI